ncbi:Intercellular Adhesion Molecule 5 [Manis pentadactyla]|nr:Intercellular Adhesion Molecule 5 [Manis pentadactyla]
MTPASRLLLHTRRATNPQSQFRCKARLSPAPSPGCTRAGFAKVNLLQRRGRKRNYCGEKRCQDGSLPAYAVVKMNRSLLTDDEHHPDAIDGKREKN